VPQNLHGAEKTVNQNHFSLFEIEVGSRGLKHRFYGNRVITIA